MSERQSADSAEAKKTVFQDHTRLFDDNRFVYPVVSRRSKGVSVGVNLNPDRICNFDCIYCQVDRRSESETRFVAFDELMTELEQVLELVVSGEIYQHPRFVNTPVSFRRLNDIAFSGDGEPTTYRNFDQIISEVAIAKRRLAKQARMVLITNASMFHRDHVQRGMKIMDENLGQIWAKLDAGTEEYYKFIERTSIPFQRIIDNIKLAAAVRPIVIQSLFMNVHAVPPSNEELQAFCDRLNEVVQGGGRIELVQLYTVARQPAESYVTPLVTSVLVQIAELVQSRTGLQTAVFG